MKTSPIINAEELLLIYNQPDVLIFDATNQKNAKENYNSEHIEGAFFIDLNSQLADIKSNLALGGRHPLPEIDNFATTLTNLGITKEKHIVIYDNYNGSNAAARFWWMLKSAGHTKVQVLNGGLNEAKKHQIPINSKIETILKASEPYEIKNWNLPTIELTEVEKIAKNKNHLVIDVRDKNRFDGKTEPIDLIAGHIPGAINLPFTENLDQNGLFLPPNILNQKYHQFFSNFKPENIVVHCGSGVTACHTLLALDYANFPIPKLYVGSWSEWSRNNKKIGTNL